MDGSLNDDAWDKTHPLAKFVDITGDPRKKPQYRTRVWMCWNYDFLFIAALLSDPNVRASLTNRDSIVYHDNDFEVFLDPDGDGLNYLEIEVNAMNTVLDLLLDKPYRDGGRARLEWDALHRSSVQVNGTMNDSSDTDEGWSLEMAIPWSAICEFSMGPCPPRGGDVWRMNFSRVQWPEGVQGGPGLVGKGIENNWVWSPQGEVNMHIPDRWGFVEFVGPGG